MASKRENQHQMKSNSAFKLSAQKEALWILSFSDMTLTLLCFFLLLLSIGNKPKPAPTPAPDASPSPAASGSVASGTSVPLPNDLTKIGKTRKY